METPSTITMVSKTSSQETGKQDSKWCLRQLLPQVIAALVSSISAFCMGSVEAFSSPALPSMLNSTKLKEPLSSDDQSKVASIALLGALLSGPQVGFLIGKIGRKSVLAINTLPFVVGWLLIASTNDFPLIYLGRFITGFCAGTASLVVPIYIGEVSDDKNRGLLCSLFQLSATMGNFFVYVVGTYLDWQWLAFVCGMVPLVGLLLTSFIPATPTFLLSKERYADALYSLMWLRGAKTGDEVEHELQSIQSNLIACTAEDTSFKDFLKLRTMRPLAICLFLLLFQQMTGIEVILVYTVYIFDAAEISIDANICTMIVGFLQIVGTLFSAVLVDKAGRRILLIISQLGTSFSMFALVMFFHYKDADDHSDLNMDFLPLTSLCVFIIFFAVGVGPVPYLMIAELNSPAVIGVASAITTTFYWTFAYVTTAFFMDIEESIGLAWCFGLFSGFSLIGSIFVYIFVPETKGKSMEEIQNYFRKTGKSEILSGRATAFSISSAYHRPYRNENHVNANEVSTRF